MTTARPRPFPEGVRAGLLVAGLAVVVLGRWAATVGLAGGALVIGLAFGLALLGVAAAGARGAAEPLPPTGVAAPSPVHLGVRVRPGDQGHPRGIVGRALPAVAMGVLGGVALIGLAVVPRLVAPALPVPIGQQAWIQASLLPWAAVTILVASAEELVLRGALFSAIQASGGQLVAVLLTSIVFALMHVPLYGWHVVPLDLGVGFFLAGLRLLSGGVVAPAIAHALADLATAWL